jgi:hypothetical protein
MDDESISPVESIEPQKSWADRNPKLSILLIAGVFYLILFGMCAFIIVLLFRG